LKDFMGPDPFLLDHGTLSGIKANAIETLLALNQNVPNYQVLSKDSPLQEVIFKVGDFLKKVVASVAQDKRITEHPPVNVHSLSTESYEELVTRYHVLTKLVEQTKLQLERHPEHRNRSLSCKKEVIPEVLTTSFSSCQTLPIEDKFEDVDASFFSDEAVTSPYFFSQPKKGDSHHPPFNPLPTLPVSLNENQPVREQEEASELQKKRKLNAPIILKPNGSGPGS
jgi:hypothetical protein